MSFRTEFQQTVRAITQLSSAGTADLARDEIDIALSGRRAVIQLLSTVLDDVTGLSPPSSPMTLESAAVHPVLGLSGALRHYPSPPTAMGPLSAFMQEPQTPSGRAWRDLARHAALAHDVWSRGVPEQIDPTAAWSAVADVAGLASLLADVDGDLLRTIKARTGRSDTVIELEPIATSGLGMIAREVARLAEAGPLNDAGPDRRPPADRPQILQVSEPHELVAAIRQVGVLVRDAQRNSPEQVRRVVVGHVRTCKALAEVLNGVGDEHEAAAAMLREHAAKLATSIEREWPIASVERGDKRAQRQVTGVLFAIDAAERSDLTAAVEPKTLLAAIAATTRDVAAAVRRYLMHGQWLTPISDAYPVRSRTWERYVGWQRVSSATPLPRQVTRLFDARDHAAALSPPEEPASAPPGRLSPGAAVNPPLAAPPTADPAAPRPPPAGGAADALAASTSWRELARHRTTSRPTAPWQRPATPYPHPRRGRRR
jgi:hypothetical protein